MQRAIKSITIQYTSATGEALEVTRRAGKSFGQSEYTRIRTRLCGGVGGMFTVYLDRIDGTLVTIKIPQARIVSVTTIQEKAQ